MSIEHIKHGIKQGHGHRYRGIKSFRTKITGRVIDDGYNVTREGCRLVLTWNFRKQHRLLDPSSETGGVCFVSHLGFYHRVKNFAFLASNKNNLVMSLLMEHPESITTYSHRNNSVIIMSYLCLSDNLIFEFVPCVMFFVPCGIICTSIVLFRNIFELEMHTAKYET